MPADFVRDARALKIQLVSGRGHYLAVIEPVLEASRSVWIATANLKELMVEDGRARPGKRRSQRRFRSVLAVFEEQVSRGVEIRLLHAGRPSRRFNEELDGRPGLTGSARQPGSFEMRLCPRVHFKAVIVDGARVYLGSANWTGAGLGAKGEARRNFEIGFVSRDDLLLDEVQSLYDEIWRGAPCSRCRLRSVCPGPLDEPAATAARPKLTGKAGKKLRPLRSSSRGAAGF